MDLIATPLGRSGSLVLRAWLSKLGPQGDQLVYRHTLLGARGMAVAVDQLGNAYFAGILEFGVEYNVTPSALNQPDGLGFLMKLSPNGKLLYAARLAAQPLAVTVDREGNAYLTGIASESFAATPDGFDTTPGDDCPPADAPGVRPCADAFAARLSNDGERLDWATLLGGLGEDSGSAIALDESGAVYVAGETTSPDFPTTPGSLQETYGGSAGLGPITFEDGFLVKLDAAGRTLLYGTFLGGSEGDWASGLAVSAEGRVAVVGTTQSRNFPVSANAVQPQYGGGFDQPTRAGDVFFVQLSPDGVVLQSSYWGGVGSEASGEAKLFPDGKIAVTTWSDTRRGPCERLNHLLVFSGSDAFEVYDLPGFEDISGPAVAIGQDGSAYLAGRGGTSGFTITENAVNRSQQVLAMRVDPARSAGATVDCVANAASLALGRLFSAAYATVAPGEIVSVFGRQLGPAEGVVFPLDAEGKVPTRLAGSRVLVNGSEIPLLYVSHRQINAVVPLGLAAGEVTIEVESDQGRTRAYKAESFPVVPAFFSLDSSGLGQAAAFNEDGTLNSPQNPARRGSVISLFATGLGEFTPALDDGAVVPIAPPFPRLAQHLELFVAAAVETGAAGMEILYAGAAPGLVAGVAQINARIPPLARSGDAVPIRVLTDLEFERSQDFVTIAVE